MIIYISIGNSDDKLGQQEWSEFHGNVDMLLRRYAETVHGAWVSESSSPWQNACWCIEVNDKATSIPLKSTLRRYAAAFQQESIAWAEAQDIQFLVPL
jgi:hypothetical protein